jgi:hypothetical protein
MFNFRLFFGRAENGLGIKCACPLLLAAVACSAAPLPREVRNTPFYFPTTVGAKWVYESSDGKIETVVVSAVEQDGEDLIVSREGADGTTMKYLRTIVNAEGLRQTSGEDNSDWILRAKLKSGESWEMAGGIRRSVFGPEEVSVPAGKYQSLRVTWDQNGSTWTSWYAPGIGEIKRVMKRGDTETVFRTLQSFEPDMGKKR